jgi:hypothetical protein
MKSEKLHVHNYQLIWLTIFAVSMGLLEAAVVIYLRELYYPEGFKFPLRTISGIIVTVELCREAATILMLFAAGMLTGKNFMGRLAYFIYCFAVWDILYYVFLKLFVNWPESLLSWDILFLIPVPWIGPVLAPLLLSVTMIIFTFIILCANRFHEKVTLLPAEWLLLLTGSLVVILSFTMDYTCYLLNHYSLSDIFSADKQQAIFNLAGNFLPKSFNWWIFITGEVIILAGIFLFWRRNKKAPSSKGM